jgi:hypothetical protein
MHALAAGDLQELPATASAGGQLRNVVPASGRKLRMHGLPEFGLSRLAETSFLWERALTCPGDAVASPSAEWPMLRRLEGAGGGPPRAWLKSSLRGLPASVWPQCRNSMVADTCGMKFVYTHSLHSIAVPYALTKRWASVGARRMVQHNLDGVGWVSPKHFTPRFMTTELPRINCQAYNAQKQILFW